MHKRRLSWEQHKEQAASEGSLEDSPLLRKPSNATRPRGLTSVQIPTPRVDANATQAAMSSAQEKGLMFLQDHKNVEDNYSKLDPDSVSRAAFQLAMAFGIDDSEESAAGADIGNRSRSLSTRSLSRMSVSKVSLSEEFSGIVMFKNRPMNTSTLLHFCIWFASEFGGNASIIQDLLDIAVDPDDIFLPASYGAGSKVIYVSAVHLAAGFGRADILKVLTLHASASATPNKRMLPGAYVSQWAQQCPINTTREAYMEPDEKLASKLVNFYQPIHDSTYAGNAEVTMFLLKNGADPCSKNLYKVTPLHFVAYVGIQEQLEGTEGRQIHEMIKALQRTGKAVGARADLSNFIPGFKDVTPLEVAIADQSRFPQDYLGMLAPCLVDDSTSQLTYFDEIKRIADVTAEGALKLVRSIGEKGAHSHSTLRRFRINAQMEGKSDVLASILYTAPLAASEMLELLEVAPEVEDASHHAIPVKASLWGFFEHSAMLCTYECDVTKKEGLMLPFWEWQKNEEDHGTWHERFIPKTKRQARSTYIKNIRVVVSLLPGILDIDVFMALTQCLHCHLAIMSQKTVQGAIHCVWENLISNVWCLEACFRFVDLAAYVSLSVLVHSGDHLSSLSWPIITSGILSSIGTLLCHSASLLRKWHLAVDDTMHEMWSPYSVWNMQSCFTYIFHSILGSGLVLNLLWKHHLNADRDKFDDALLATCLLISCFRFIWMWRLSVVGGRLYTISQTFLAGAVNQMLFITFMLLVSFILALMVLSRLPSWKLAIDSYRGFLFGDGDGFNGVGMDVDHDYKASLENNVSLVGFSVFGSFFFNVIVLNIIIAIYGNTYDKVQQDTPLFFMKGRAEYCVKTILSCYVIPWKGANVNRCLIGASMALLVTGVFVAKQTQDLMWLAAGLMAAGQLLLPMALVQCAWFSPEGSDSDERLRYLWMCHPRDWQGPVLDDDEDVDARHQARHDTLEGKMTIMDDRMEAIDAKIERILRQTASQ